jgi:hypothetical protein
MKVSSVEAVLRALNGAGVEYLVAGGLAVNAHGYGRATFDVDLVVRLTPKTVDRLFAVLASLGYMPLVPVRAEEFGDRETRERFIREKGMVVLQFWSDQHRETRVDVFAREPFDFGKEFQGAHLEDLAPGVPVRFVALRTLIQMKELAGRPKDLDDARHLRWIQEEIGDEDP